MAKTRDLWWEARQSHKPNRVIELARNVTQSLPGRPTKQVFAALSLGRENAALAIDLNKYRPNRNLKAYQDAGVDVFILRIGGPTQWIEGDWRYEIDATYRPYLEQLDNLNLLGRSVGYIVHNPFEIYTQNGATGETIHTELIDEWTSGGYMPLAFCYDHEVATCWRGGTKITATPFNVVKSLDENTLNTWNKFKRMVSIYTARWFVNANGLQNHITYFDNVNRPEVGKQRPMWWAWYPQTFSAEYTDLQDALDVLLVPTAAQTAAYLQCGSYSLADLWQFTASLKLAGDTVGVDASVSLGSLTDCLTAFGLAANTTPPPPPPPPPPAPDYAALEARVTALEAAYANHTHTTGKPG